MIKISTSQVVRFPTGNEFGANRFWQTGRRTNGNIPEAIVAPVTSNSYTFSLVFKPIK